MAELTNQQKKECASVLYMKENLTQAELAEKVGVSRITVNKCIKAEKWEERKTGITLTKQEQINNLYRQVAEINKAIAARKDGERFASSKEADVLGKLSSAIKKMESDIGISDIITTGTHFIEWLRPVDLDMAKQVTRLFDAFIKDRL